MSYIIASSSDDTLVGAKAAKLALLASVDGINIPPYFVLATDAFNCIIGRNSDKIKRLKGLAAESLEIPGIALEIQDDILLGDFPEHLANIISNAYHEFSQRMGEQDALVSVRSSATAEDGTKASFAGQYTTCLNIRGTADLLGAIRRVWASTYSSQAISYRIKHHYPPETTRMAVIIQKMVDAVSAGTIYTVDPETGIPMICINAVPGLGVADVSGEMTPSSWLIDPRSMTMIKRRSAAGSTDCPLESAAILELASQVNKISDYFKANWQIPILEAEFACDRNGRVFFTQVRPETVWSHGKARLTAVDLDKVSHVTRIFQGGVTGCPGVVSGVLRVVYNIDEAEAVVQAGDILVTPNTTNIWERIFGRINGIITVVGGTGSHTAVVMREIGKPALVGAGHAMQSLRDYDNSLITLDATQRILFAGVEASECTHQLKTVIPAYGSADCQTEEDAWSEAATLQGRTRIDSSGQRWINKPDYPVCRFMQSIYLETHKWIGSSLQTPVRNEIHENVHRIAFADLFQWRIRLRQMNLDDLEKLHDEREEAFADYLDTSRTFELKHDVVKNWLMMYIRVNAFIGFGFDIYKVTEGMLESALAQKNIVEPYYTQIRSARQDIGELESSRAARSLYLLADEVRNNPRLTEVLEASWSLQDDAPVKTEANELFYKKLEHHTSNYKVTCVAEINQSRTQAVLAVVREILNIIGGCRTNSHKSNMFPSEKDVQFFPDDPYLQQVLRLTLASEKARQDSHHLRVRGHWLIRDKVEQLCDYLIREGRIGSFEELFDHTPDWLLTQVAEYEVSKL